MAIDRRLLNWGIFFIALGAVPLLVQQGVVSHAVAGEAWKLWPLIIVGIGIGILLRRTPVAFAGGLVVAATFGLLIGGLLATGPNLSNISGCGNPNVQGAAVTSQGSGTFSGTGTARIQMNCGVLNVTTNPGDGWSFQGQDPQDGPAVLVQDPASLDISAPSRSDAFWNVNGDHNRSWQVSLPTDPSVGLTVGVNAGSGQIDLANAHLSSLDAEINAADVHLDLSSATVSDLRVSVNASSGHVSLPASSSTAGSISVNAGSLDLCLPPSSGLRIHSKSALSSTNLAMPGVWSGDTWTSDSFAGAANHIDLQLDANLASVNVNPAGGCR